MLARLTQAKASFLLLLFLAAGTSLPSLDALAFHQDAAGERSRTHIEPAGGCLSHADQCTLGRTASGSGAVAATPGESRLIAAGPSDSPRSPRLQPSCAFTGALPHSRAPPTPFV
jgi:hypothetical protein